MSHVRADELTERRCSAEEYLGLPESKTQCSLIDGALIEEPAASDFHQNVSIRLAARLQVWAEQTGLGIVRTAPSDVWLDDRTVVQPDVYFVAHARVRYIRQWLACAPNWLAEILSPSTQRLDRDRKRRLYAVHGVQEMWLIDPVVRTVEIYRFAVSLHPPVAMITPNELLTSAVLPGLTLPVNELFGV